MIQTAEITAAPLSGQFPELIYPAPKPSSSDWTWVRFEDEEYNVFYGQFQGASKIIAVSEKIDYCYVLVDYFLYEINRNNPNEYTVFDVIEDFSLLIQNIAILPTGQLLLTDHYRFYLSNAPLQKSESQFTELETTVCSVADIEFQKWEGPLLHMNAFEFFIGTPLKLTYNYLTNEFKIINN